MPITSPVLFISGPRTESAPAKRANGSTASLTLTCSAQPLAAGPLGELLPQHQPRATLASGTPIALETKGTVREARGLASIT